MYGHKKMSHRSDHKTWEATHVAYLNHDLLYNNRRRPDRPGLFISLKKHCENVSEKEPIFTDEGATVRALLKNKNAEKYV
jgi:hypothetical protein